MAGKKGWIPARGILWLLVFFGTGYNYVVRLNINIAIVSMVKTHENETSTDLLSGECFDAKIPINDTADGLKSKGIYEQKGKFDWDEYEQGMILGAFYWTYWAGQIPGGFLSQKFGTKLIFGISNLGLCLCGFFIPIAANFDYRALVLIRVVQGFIGGLAWPSLNTIVGLWIPPQERSRFITSYIGSSVGAALIYPLCGLLLDWFDWPVVFYITSAVGIIWFTAWWLCVYDSPEDHPNISENELLYIKESLGTVVTKNKATTPWKKILLSFPLWVNIISQWGNLWGLFTLITQAPTYFQSVHGMDVQTNGIFSGLPHVGRLLVSYLVSAGCDYLLLHNKMSPTNVRKLATAICCFVQGAFIFCLAFTGCNYTAAIVLVTLATSSTGAEAAGAMGNLVDLSPNYASIMLGIGQTVSVISGMISPMVVSCFTYHDQTVEQWKNVFLVTAAVTAIPGFISLCFTSSELQEWNSPNEDQNHELEKLQSCPSAEEEKLESRNHSQA